MDPSSHFGDLVTEAIKRAMKHHEMSGRGLARRLGKSEGYVRDRLNGTFEFTLGDIESFALFVGINPEDFIAAIDREALEPYLPARDRAPVRARSLAEILATPDDSGTSEDVDLHEVDLDAEEYALAASDDDTAVDPEREIS